MQRSILPFACVLLCVIIAGCGPGGPAAGTADPAVEPEAAIPETSIIADGRLVPEAWVRPGFATSGAVAEILVNPGDVVERDADMIRLDGGVQAEAAVAAARAELLASRQARQALEDQLPAERVRALKALIAARQAVREAEAQVAYLEGESPGAEAERAEAQLLQAAAALDDAETDFEDYADEDREDTTRVQRQLALANARLTYEEASRAVEAHTEGELERQLELARTTLKAAQLQLAVTQDAYDSLEGGSNPDAVLAADARVEVAEVRLAAAESQLAALTLTAPMAGMVVQVDVKVGELVAPSVPVVVVADLSEWWIETDNLTQIDVVAIEPGREAGVVLDALPELSLKGEVVSVERLFQEKRGEVTYTARLRLSGTDPRLRWGMTCAVTFAAP